MFQKYAKKCLTLMYDILMFVLFFLACLLQVYSSESPTSVILTAVLISILGYALLPVWVVMDKLIPLTESLVIKCNDSSIGHPLIVDPDLSFNSKTLSMIIVPIIILIIITLTEHLVSPTRSDDVKLDVTLIGLAIVASQCVAGVTAEWISRTLGVLSPNFLAVCTPDAELLESLCAKSTQLYAHVNCNGTLHLVQAARHACPSVWVTAMTCVMTTLFLWAHYRVIRLPCGTKSVRLWVRRTIQLVAIASTFSVAFVTYFRNEGDWVDVSAGFAWGAFVSWITFGVLINQLLGWKEDQQHQPPPSESSSITSVV